MSTLSRRRFLETGLVAGASLSLLPDELLAASPPDLVDVSGNNHEAMVRAAVKGLGGIKRFVRKGDYVVIKPNAAFANPPEWATTTHPATVIAMCKLCLEAGADEVLVVEFPQAKGKKCLDRCGLSAALAKVPAVKVKLLGGKGDFKKRTVKGGKVLHEVAVAKAVLSADVLINIPVAKAHDAAGVSFGLKNHMGLIYDRKVFHTQFDLSQGVADLGRVIKPQLTLVDATRALLTNGPAGPGDTATPGRMIAGADLVAVDAYTLGVASFNKRKMSIHDARHIALAAQAGLGRADIRKLRIKKIKT